VAERSAVAGKAAVRFRSIAPPLQLEFAYFAARAYPINT
jgi:hypothetical protein